MEIDSPDFKPRYIGSPLSSPVSQKNWAQQIPEPVVFAYNDLKPDAVLQAPVVLFSKELIPTAALCAPVVLPYKA